MKWTLEVLNFLKIYKNTILFCGESFRGSSEPLTFAFIMAVSHWKPDFKLTDLVIANFHLMLKVGTLSLDISGQFWANIKLFLSITSKIQSVVIWAHQISFTAPEPLQCVKRIGSITRLSKRVKCKIFIFVYTPPSLTGTHCKYYKTKISWEENQNNVCQDNILSYSDEAFIVRLQVLINHYNMKCPLA